MKNTKKLVVTSLLSILLASITTPLIVIPISAEEIAIPVTLTVDGDWYYIQNDIITIIFPKSGSKPMFLWWNTENPDTINVVKFKGLVEYSTYERPYLLWRSIAEAWRIEESIEAHYYMPRQHTLINGLRSKALQILWRIGNASGLHDPYLPFSGCTWRLDGPENVTKGDVRYLSFNFTLVDVPGYRPNFQFAEENIVIRCRFYYTPATEDAYGKYSYTVDAGELKIDIVIKHWEWNIDKLEPMIEELRDLNFTIPKTNAGLALWVNLASINMTRLGIAKEDAESTSDVDLTENSSTVRNMFVEGERVSVIPNYVGNDEIPLVGRWRERFRIRFESDDATFAGFFKFVPQAIVTDGVTYNTTNVSASYISGGNYMRLFIGYPYFGNYTLEHDPSIGLESVATWLPTRLLLLLIGATIIIGVTIAVVKVRRKTVNIINMHT
jgi:hypothetical protein